MPHRLRRTGFALGTALLMSVCALLVVEAGLRVSFADSTDFSMEMWKYATELKQPVDDPQLRFVHIPQSQARLMGVDVRTNAAGLRNGEVEEAKPQDVFRVWMLGDSTTFGWGAPASDTAPALLAQALRHEAGPSRRFEVINAGVGNYNTVQEVASYLHQGRRFRPDLVVLTYFINDAEPIGREAGNVFTRHSYTAAFVASRFDVVLRVAGIRPGWKDYYRSLYDADRPGWIACQDALRNLAHITRDDGTRLLVAILPELREINGDYPFGREHALVKAVLNREGVATMDLIEGLRGHGPEPSLFVTPLDPHPNRKANLLVASQIQQWMITSGVNAPPRHSTN